MVMEISRRNAFSPSFYLISCTDQLWNFVAKSRLLETQTRPDGAIRQVFPLSHLPLSFGLTSPPATETSASLPRTGSNRQSPSSRMHSAPGRPPQVPAKA